MNPDDPFAAISTAPDPTVQQAKGLDPFDAISKAPDPTVAKADTAASPGLLDRLKATGRSMLPQPGESIAGAVGRDALGLAKGAVQPFATIAKEGIYQQVDPLHQWGDKVPGALARPTNSEMAEAAPQALAAVAAPMLPIGKLASPLARAAARVATGAGVGAVYQPNDPLQGAVIGGALGGVHAGASEATADMSLDPLKQAIVNKVSPETVAQAKQAGISEAAAAGARSAMKQAMDYNAAKEQAAQARLREPQSVDAEFAKYSGAWRDRAIAQANGTAVAEARPPVQIPPDAPDAATGNLPARPEERPVTTDGPAPRPLLPRGVDDAATPAQPDPGLQPALHDAGQLEYRNAGLSGLPDKFKGALDRTYTQLDHDPQDVQLKQHLLAAGAGWGHGMYVAQRGGAYIKQGLDPADVSHIGAQITADQMKAYADSYRNAGDTQNADLVDQHIALALRDVPADIKSTAAWQTYVGRFREVYERHYNETSTKTGVPEENFRAVQPGSVYSPLASDQIIQKPKVLRTLIRNGTSRSSAARIATGTGSYSLDPTEAAERFMPVRTKIAAQNDLWQAVRTRGREMTGKREALQEGEVPIAFDDAMQFTDPESPSSRHYIALPEHVYDAVKQYVDRTNAPTGQGGFNQMLTQAAVVGSPAIGLTHGGSIAQTVNMASGTGPAEIARTVASAIPGGNTLAGIVDMNRIDLNDPATIQRQFAVSKYGGLRPFDPTPETPAGPQSALQRGKAALKRVGGKVHKDLFGVGGMDEKGRAVVAQRLMEADPDAHPATVAETLGQMFGQYNKANQPAAIYQGQSKGFTSFAPAGIGFTTEAVKRATGQRGVLPFVKQVAAPVAGMTALNYAMSGHSPLANEPGHRLDLDTGEQDDQGREKYGKLAYLHPLLNRAANTTGVRPLIEGEGLSGAISGAANEAMAQVGVIPRALAGFANSTLREARGYNGLDQAVKPQFGEGQRLVRIAQGAASPFLGAAGGIGGFSPFDGEQSFKDRVLNAAHANAIGTGRVGESSPDDDKFNQLHDRVRTAETRVYRAKSDLERASVIQTELKRAKADGYSADALDEIEATLSRAAEKSAQDRADMREAAMSKKGLGDQ